MAVLKITFMAIDLAERINISPECHSEDKPRVGIWITGGGTMGGRSPMGMFQYLEEIGLYPDYIKAAGGVSLGALCLMGVVKNMTAAEMSEFSLSLNSSFQFTPNKETKIGASNLRRGMDILRDTLFEGENPSLNSSDIPLVLGGTDMETGQPHFFCDDYPVLDALRQSLSNPFMASLERNSHGVIGDGGMSCSVGVDFIREKYNLDKVILFDIQTAGAFQIENDQEPLAPWQKGIIEVTEKLTKLPRIGEALKELHLPWWASTLVHGPSTLKLLSRSSVILLSRLVEEQIKNQKPDVVIRLEDAVGTMKDQSFHAYKRENGLLQIENGYKAAKLKENELLALFAAI